MLSIINKPYPYFLNKQETVKVILIIAVFTFLICLILKPFELRMYPFWQLLLVSILNALLVFFSLTFSQLVFSYFNSSQNEENWTILKEIFTFFWHLLVLGIFAYLINWVLDPTKSNISAWFTYSFVRPLLGAVFILPLVIFLKRFFILQKDNRDLKKISSIIKEKRKKEEFQKQNIELISNDKQENLSLNIENILFFKSSENYVEVNYFIDSKLESVLLRNTLKNINKKIKPYDCFFQCHRSYIINLNKVDSFSGNSKGYLVSFENFPLKVPVARSLIEAFKNRLR